MKTKAIIISAIALINSLYPTETISTYSKSKSSIYRYIEEKNITQTLPYDHVPQESLIEEWQPLFKSAARLALQKQFDEYQVALKAGWERQQGWSQNQLSKFIHPDDMTQFVFNGFTLKLRFDF